MSVMVDKSIFSMTQFANEAPKGTYNPKCFFADKIKSILLLHTSKIFKMIDILI